MRYVSKEPPAPRTSELVVRDMQLSLRLGITINGFKGASPLMNLPGVAFYPECLKKGSDYPGFKWSKQTVAP